MTDAVHEAPPTTILLATDLGPWGDRAMARAVLLARQWRARLLAVTVVASERSSELQREILPPPDWARPGTPVDDARRELQRMLDGCGADVSIVVETGEVGPALLRVAHEHDCGLIVTGAAHGGPLAASLPGAVNLWLSRHATQPLLVVRDRARHDYRHVVFATDFSAAAQHAMRVGADWFVQAMDVGALLHAVEPSAIGRLDPRAGDPIRSEAIADARAQAREALDAAGLGAPARTRIETVIERMEPARLVREYVRSHDADLVCIGSHGRSALAEVLLGSTAGRILETAGCDVLLVRRRG